jgi:hypothetical protein
MTDWRIRLRDAGRALRDDVVPEERSGRTWSRAFAATAAVLTLVSVGLLTSLQGGRLTDDNVVRVEPIDPALVTATDEAPVAARQQLHFSTPGGTRIIWVFDPGFEVKGTLP